MDETDRRRFSNPKSPIYLGVLLAVGFWLMESAVHSYVFHDGTFFGQFIPHDANEAWMRLLIVVIFAAFSIYARCILSRLARAEKKLMAGLRGCIPICAYCKRIRDEKGRWNRLETYISRHSGAEFTHGICPECEASLNNGAGVLAGPR